MPSSVCRQLSVVCISRRLVWECRFAPETRSSCILVGDNDDILDTVPCDRIANTFAHLGWYFEVRPGRSVVSRQCLRRLFLLNEVAWCCRNLGAGVFRFSSLGIGIHHIATWLRSLRIPRHVSQIQKCLQGYLWNL